VPLFLCNFSLHNLGTGQIQRAGYNAPNKQTYQETSPQRNPGSEWKQITLEINPNNFSRHLSYTIANLHYKRNHR